MPRHAIPVERRPLTEDERKVALAFKHVSFGKASSTRNIGEGLASAAALPEKSGRITERESRALFGIAWRFRRQLAAPILLIVQEHRRIDRGRVDHQEEEAMDQQTDNPANESAAPPIGATPKPDTEGQRLLERLLETRNNLLAARTAQEKALAGLRGIKSAMQPQGGRCGQTHTAFFPAANQLASEILQMSEEIAGQANEIADKF
jgi:hypothetical protein